MILDSLVQYQAALSQCSREKREIKRLKKELKTWIDVQSRVQHIAAETQQLAHHKIAAVVSKCLSTVFDEPYSLRIDFVKKRGKTEAIPVFVRGNVELDFDSVGAGVVDIAAFALRLACVVGSIPPLRRVLILDEPFRHVAFDLRPLAAQLLKTLAEEMNVQFVIVTHDEQLATGKIIRLG